MQQTGLQARLTKQALRKRLRVTRRDLQGAQRDQATGAALARLVSLLSELKPQRVALSTPIDGEIDLLTLPDLVGRQGSDAAIAWALPVTQGEAMTFVSWTGYVQDLEAGAGFGTLKPAAQADVVHPDCIVVPCVGLDWRGHRLGFGKGFYDRTLAAMHRAGRVPVTIGVCFDGQIVPQLPHEPHDQRLDHVISDARAIRIR